jgi:hypothetical protein
MPGTRSATAVGRGGLIAHRFLIIPWAGKSCPRYAYSLALYNLDAKVFVQFLSLKL